MKPVLTEQDFISAANELGCEVAVIKAVCEVEAPRGGFLDNDKPVILYEPFLFGDMTKHRYNGETIFANGVVYPLSRNRRIMPWSVANAKYGPSSVQHIKLIAAKRFARDEAFMACSWGKFQILGSNYRLCGFTSIEDFIQAMYESEKAHLMAFISFIKNSRLDDELRLKQWERFAYQYNGPRQDKGTRNPVDDYDFFLEKAYKKHAGKA